jgi:predicted RNA methylase
MSAAVQLAIPGAGPVYDPALSQWCTPPDLALRLVDWAAGLAHAKSRPPAKWRVLEPSAGSGSFVNPMLERFGSVTAHEIDPAWAEHLRTRFPARKCPGLRVVEGDYLAAPRPSRIYDLAVLNPPYEDEGDWRFVEKAMDEAMRVLALVRLNFFCGRARFEHVWKQIGTDAAPGDWWLGGAVFFATRPKFSGADGGAKSDFVALYLTRDEHEVGSRYAMDWWMG